MGEEGAGRWSTSTSVQEEYIDYLLADEVIVYPMHAIAGAATVHERGHVQERTDLFCAGTWVVPRAAGNLDQRHDDDYCGLAERGS